MFQLWKYITTAFSMYSSLESGLQNSWRTFWNDYYQYINVSQLLVFWGLFYSSLVLCKAPTKNRHQWRPIFFRRVVILSARPLFVRSFFHIRHIILSQKAYYDLFWNFFFGFFIRYFVVDLKLVFNSVKGLTAASQFKLYGYVDNKLTFV